MSDSIVLWRMCVVWSNALPLLALSGALIVATCTLNVANIVAIGSESPYVDVGFAPNIQNSFNAKNIGPASTYGAQNVGLAAAFLSLTSNLCATILVGVRAW